MTKLKGNIDIKFNSLTNINTLDDTSIFINKVLEKEAYILEKVFNKLKIYDMTITYAGPYAFIDSKRIKSENSSIGKLLHVKDLDGNEWWGNDIYYFMIQEAFAYEVNDITESVIPDKILYYFIVLAVIRGVDCDELTKMKEQLTKLNLTKEDLETI